MPAKDPSPEPVKRRKELIALRRQGLLNHQIAERLGLSERVVSTELYRAKQAGMDVPRSPYYKLRSS